LPPYCNKAKGDAECEFQKKTDYRIN
jgi:hypothetical protein